MNQELHPFLQPGNDEQAEQETNQLSGRYEEVLDIFERFNISTSIREAYFKRSGIEASPIGGRQANRPTIDRPASPNNP
jgi:hypothetical protein